MSIERADQGPEIQLSGEDITDAQLVAKGLGIAASELVVRVKGEPESVDIIIATRELPQAS